MKSKVLLLAILFFGLSINSKADCGLNDPIISNIKCLENAVYEFDLNFSFSANDLDSFDIYINGNIYGKFSVLQLPVKVTQNIFSGKKFDLLQIVDPTKDNCFVTKEIENPCGCALFGFRYAKTKCTGSDFNIVLDFNHFETSDSFDIGMISKSFGRKAFKNLPVTIGPFKVHDTLYNVSVFDSQDFFCFGDFRVNGRSCPDCNIRDLKMIGKECDNNKIYLKLSFLHSSVKSGKYVVTTNTGYEKIAEYKNKIIVDSVSFREDFVLGPISSDCDNNVVITVWDFENKPCQTALTLDSLCCQEPCTIGDIFVKEIECTSDSTYNFTLNFQYENSNSDKFFANINNQISGFYGFNELPKRFTGIKIDGSTNDFVKICLNNNECCKAKEYAVPDCNTEPCVIENPTWTAIFDTLAGKYWIKLSFDYKNSSDQFTIKGNGINYGTFKYDNLPVILGSYKCNEALNLEYVIRDLNNESCKLTVVPGKITCPTSSTISLAENSDWDIFYSDENKILELTSATDVFKNAKVSVLNIIGQKLLKINLRDGINLFTTEISGLSKGMYLIDFDNNGNRIIKKIIVTR